MIDAIEIRPALLYSPKVQKMARFLVGHEAFRRWLSGYGDICPSQEGISHVAISALVQVWSAARKVAHDGYFDGFVVSDLDRIAGVPCLGEAMVQASWAKQVIGGVQLANFTEYNPSGRPEPVSVLPPPAPKEAPLFPDAKYPEDFLRFWEAYPKKVGKGAAFKVWKKLRPSKTTVEDMLIAIAGQRRSRQWLKDQGQFVPHPATWLNQARWEDAPEGGPLLEDTAARLGRIESEAKARHEAGQI